MSEIKGESKSEESKMSRSGVEGGDQKHKSNEVPQSQQANNNKFTRMEKINLWLAIGTFALFGVAIWQGYVANSAADASENSATSAKKQVDLMKDQFLTEHTPFLIIDKGETNFFFTFANDDFWVGYSIANIGNSPVKVDSIRMGFLFSDDIYTKISDFEETFKQLTLIDRVNELAYKDTRIKSTFYPPENVSNEEIEKRKNAINAFKKGTTNIYWCGEAIYFSPFTGKKRKFVWVTRNFLKYNKTGMANIINENFDIPK